MREYSCAGACSILILKCLLLEFTKIWNLKILPLKRHGKQIEKCIIYILLLNFFETYFWDNTFHHFNPKTEISGQFHCWNFVVTIVYYILYFVLLTPTFWAINWTSASRVLRSWVKDCELVKIFILCPQNKYFVIWEVFGLQSNKYSVLIAIQEARLSS